MSNKRSPIKHALLDALIDEHKLLTDAGLARALGIMPAAICKYRGGLPITDGTRIKIQRKFKWPLSKIDKLEASNVDKGESV